MKYFQWKKYYSVVRRFPICALCEFLHKNHFQTKSYSNLQEWWYGNSKNNYCISGNGMPYHSSKIRGLRSTKCSSETLQNLLCFMYINKTHVVFFIFHFVQLYFIANFEAFHWNISLSANLLFLKSG